MVSKDHQEEDILAEVSLPLDHRQEEVVDLQEHLQELMVDQVVVDLLLILVILVIIMEQVFVDKVIQVEEVMMLLLPL